MRKLALLALIAAAGCSQNTQSAAPPLDRFYYPTGIALRHVPAGCTGGAAGCQTQLVVGSSNFDLQYDIPTGGTIIGVDVGDTIVRAGSTPAEPLAPTVVGSARVGSFGGEVAIVDEETCPGWETGGHAPQALVASRAQVALYRVGLTAGAPPNAFTCGDGCSQALDATSADPYGVTVACGRFPVNAAGQPVPEGQLQASAIVTYLRTPNGDGRVSRVDLAGGEPQTLIALGVSPSASSAYDPVDTRLWVTSRFQNVGVAPLRWFDLAAPGLGVSSADLGLVVRGLEMRQLALSSDAASAAGRRGYLAMRLYDVDLATTIGVRPTADLAGALAVLDLSNQASGLPSLAILNTVAVGRGANEVRVIKRVDAAGNPLLDAAGKPLRDLVAVSGTDDDTVSLYDDATGAVSKVFDLCTLGDNPRPPDPCPEGRPQLGKQPFGLAVETFQRGPGTPGGAILQPDGTPVPLARLYVGSFDRSWVNVIEIDPAHPAARSVGGVALRWDRIGAERP